MPKTLDKFCLLMWKNWILQIRHPVKTIFEILLPVLFCILIVLIRLVEKPVKYDSAFYQAFDILDAMNNYSNYTMVYSPFNKHLQGIVKDTLKSLKMNSSMKEKVFKNSKQMELYFQDDEILKDVLAGIEFDDSLSGDSDLPKHITVALRFPDKLRTGTLEDEIKEENSWRTHLVFPLFAMTGPRAPTATETAPPNYYGEGFLAVQKTLTFFIMKHFNNSLNNMDILMARYPYPKWTSDPLLFTLRAFIGFIIMCGFIYNGISMIKVITIEKERQLKETMKIMGLPNWLHWTAWFFKYLIFLLIPATLIVIVFTVPLVSNFGVFTYTDPFVIFTFFLFYLSAAITFCFAITVFFSKANTAAAIGGLLWFLAFLPYMHLQEMYDTLTLSTKLLSSLCFNTAMGFGFHLMLISESTGEGLRWNNIHKNITPDDSLTLLYIIMMLIIDSIIYLLIMLYVEAVFPGEYGVPRVWYFPCTFSYWCRQRRGPGADNHQESSSNRNSSIYEKEPRNLPLGIKTINLSKTYSNRQNVVKDLSLNMYKGQITVLLGQNGAGKTTTMSMLTGMFPPTTGTAIIRGHDIRFEINKIRESLGLCPQHNILFDEMTVEEHIYFYSRLKGLKRSKIKNEINKYIRMLKLGLKANKKAATLSGGMQRKLSVILALCGNSKIVILDEPSSGMDPAARRGLWDLLISEKEGRTILLTTHFMDEADILGDRIAILVNGKLQCCGSSFFLKKKYGTGYRLTMDVSSECDPKKVTKLLSKHVPGIKIGSIFGSELIYTISVNHISIFKRIFRDLEENGQGLGIKSFGVSFATLEDVFMKIGIDKNEKHDDLINQKSIYSNVRILEFKLEKGCKLKSNQLLAMFLKKHLVTLRNWTLLLIQILIVVIIVYISLLSFRSSKFRVHESKELKFELKSYSSPVTMISGENKYKNKYIEPLNEANYKYYMANNIVDYMINITKAKTRAVRIHYIVGVTFFQDNSLLAWFNNEPYHSPPLALKMAMNAVIQTELGPNVTIEVTNKPLQFTLSQKFQRMSESGLGNNLALDITFAMAFVSAMFILFYIRERVIKFKHLQFLSGVDVCTFWIVSFLLDLLTYMIIVVCIISTIYAFQENGYKTPQEIGVLFVIFFYFGFAVLPVIYLFSFHFKTPSTGFIVMSSLFILLGFGVYLTETLLRILNHNYVADILHNIFLLVPHYALCSGIGNTYKIYTITQLCEFIVDSCFQSGNHETNECWKIACNLDKLCCKVEKNYYAWKNPGILRHIVYSISVGIIFIILVLLVEQNVCECLVKTTKKKSYFNVEETTNQDNDVLKEKLKVRRMSATILRRYALVLKDVTKYYGKYLAVNNLSLSVKPYECFGLLGLNGAGKTTTFKMLTGDIRMSQGDIWIYNNNLKQNRKKVQKYTGYCPQFDALLDELTGNETMMIFCLIRGIRRNECGYTIQRLSKALDFHKYLHKKVKQYSGGNKRKLSTAIAMIGDPPVIYLDEPTTGMDPAAKRHIWKEINRVRENGKCIILTSHSMEECEALCTRLAIMVNGEIKCIGSTQHLKSKFSDGYILIIKSHKSKNSAAQEKQMNAIDKYIKKNCLDVIVQEKYQEIVKYYIPNRNQSWSQMFAILENGKSVFNLEDYSLSQPSLEQIFLSLTKFQENQ